MKKTCAAPSLLHLALEAKTPSKADFFNAAYITRLIWGSRLPPRGAPTIGNNTSHAGKTFQGPRGLIFQQVPYFRNVFGVPLALLFSPRSWDFWLLAFVLFCLRSFFLRSFSLPYVRCGSRSSFPCCLRSSFACVRFVLLAFLVARVPRFLLACVRVCWRSSFLLRAFVLAPVRRFKG